MLDQFQNLKNHRRGQTEWCQAERVKEAGCGAWRPFLPGLYPHRVQGHNVNTITSFSPLLYNVYSLWHYMIHQIKLGSVALEPERPDYQPPLVTSYLISSMELYTAVSSTCKMQPVILPLQGYCET